MRDRDVRRAGANRSRLRPPDRSAGRSPDDRAPAVDVARLLADVAYRRLFEQSPEAQFVQTVDGVIVDANRAAADLHGWTRDELVGRPFSVTVADDADVAHAAASADVLGQGWFRRRGVGLRRDGSRFPTEVVGALLRAEEPPLALVRVADLSGPRALERAWHELGELARLGDAPNDPTTIARQATEIVVSTVGATSGALATFEGDRVRWQATVGDLPARDAIEAELTPSENPELRLVLATGRAIEVDVPPLVGLRPLAGPVAEAGIVTLWLLPVIAGEERQGALAVFFRNPPTPGTFEPSRLSAFGRIVGTALHNAYLREEMRLELDRHAALEASARVAEERYRRLFEESPDALTLQTADGRIVDVNRTALHLYRARRPDLVGRNVADLFSGERLVTRIGDGIEIYRATGRRVDGSLFPEEVVVSRLELDGEERVLARIRDLTEQDELQQELVQAQKMEAIGQLVSGVAHELNNPLAAIIAFSQLIRRDPRLPADMRRDADLLLGEADRTRRIVQNLLDFARQRPPERYPTALLPLVSSVLELQAYSLSAGRIAVEVDIPPELPPVYLDRAQLQQVLLNLTLNAIQSIRASKAPGTVRVAASETTLDGSPGIRLTISDDGPGVPAEHRDRLFLPFFTTKEPGEGTGLGLPVSFGIVAAHGGQLAFEPGPDGKGATFVITLPLGGGEDAASDGEAGAVPGEVEALGGDVREPGGKTSPPGEAPPPPARATVDADPGGTPAEAGDPDPERRVLVLDDEPAIRAFLARLLRRAGFQPVVAADGDEAIARVREAGVGAVLCDYRMAGMSGTDVFEALVAIRPELRRRFVFMSGDVLNADLAAFAGEHDIALLAKPFDIDTVRRVVGGILAREAAAG